MLNFCCRYIDILHSSYCVLPFYAVNFSHIYIVNEVFSVDLPLSEFELAAKRLAPMLHHTELDLSSTFRG